MSEKPDQPLPAALPLDEAHAFALLVWAQQEAEAGGPDEVLPYSAAITRRHTEALALERAGLLQGRGTSVPEEGGQQG
ncbi:MAG: hypothetical protein JNM31_00430 [Flavobacteriales bacterium]|nr:hypothetical protein [Flavobacteriales bacterium]